MGPVVIGNALLLLLILERHPVLRPGVAAAVALLSLPGLAVYAMVHRSRIVLRGSVIVERPVSEVFPMFADPHNASLWNSSKRGFAFASEGPVSAGTRFEFESRPPLSRGDVVRGRVTEFEPDRIVATRLEGRTLNGREVSRFEPMGSSTRIETVNEVEVSSITAWFLRAQGSKALDSGLLRLKKAAEAGDPTAA